MHPRVEIRVIGQPSSALVPMLKDNTVDLACLTRIKGDRRADPARAARLGRVAEAQCGKSGRCRWPFHARRQHGARSRGQGTEPAEDPVPDVVRGRATSACSAWWRPGRGRAAGALLHSRSSRAAVGKPRATAARRNGSVRAARSPRARRATWPSRFSANGAPERPAAGRVSAGFQQPFAERDERRQRLVPRRVDEVVAALAGDRVADRHEPWRLSSSSTSTFGTSPIPIPARTAWIR